MNKTCHPDFDALFRGVSTLFGLRTIVLFILPNSSCGEHTVDPPGLHATTKCAMFDTSCSVNTRFKIYSALFVVALLSNSQYDDDSMSMCLSY